MTLSEDDLIGEVKTRVQAAKSLYLQESSFDYGRIANLARDVYQAFLSGNRLAFVGNGGSAAEAMHLAAEFTGRCVLDHAPLPVMCLNESQSALTAIANDYGVDQMFSRQVQAHLRPGDYLIALSTSGRSPNIIRALEKSHEIGVNSFLWMGDFDTNLQGVQTWKVPSKTTPRIQEIHLTWGHTLSEIVELLLQP